MRIQSQTYHCWLQVAICLLMLGSFAKLCGRDRKDASKETVYDNDEGSDYSVSELSTKRNLSPEDEKRKADLWVDKVLKDFDRHTQKYLAEQKCLAEQDAKAIPKCEPSSAKKVKPLKRMAISDKLKLIADVEDTLHWFQGEHKDAWQHFFSGCRHWNWVCSRCLYFNKKQDTTCHTCYMQKQPNQADIEHASRVRLIQGILGRLQEDVTLPPDSSPQYWVCHVCRYLNTNREALCKICDKVYEHNVTQVQREEEAFRQYYVNHAQCFREDCKTAMQFDQEEEKKRIAATTRPASTRTPEAEIDIDALAAAHGMSAEAFRKQQAALMRHYAQAKIEVDQAWVCQNVPAAEEGKDCGICCNNKLKAGNTCQCPRCKQLFCNACYKSIFRASLHINHGIFYTNAVCPFCRNPFQPAP